MIQDARLLRYPDLSAPRVGKTTHRATSRGGPNFASSRRERYVREDEQGLTFEGFLLFADRPKEGVHQVLHELRDLGVRVKIITGDTATLPATSQRASALDGATVLTGAELH